MQGQGREGNNVRRAGRITITTVVAQLDNNGFLATSSLLGHSASAQLRAVRHWQIRETLEAANPATALQRRFDHLSAPRPRAFLPTRRLHCACCLTYGIANVTDNLRQDTIDCDRYPRYRGLRDVGACNHGRERRLKLYAVTKVKKWKPHNNNTLSLRNIGIPYRTCGF